LRRVVTAFFAATVGTAVFAGAAQAAATLTIAPVKACYLAGDEVTATGTGFTPGAPIDFSIDGTSLGQLPADATGIVAADVTLGAMKGARTHTLTATDMGNPALTVSKPYTGTTLHIDVTPKHAKAGKKLRVKGYGLLAGKKVYMHVRGPHHYKSDTKVARAKGPCGTFKIHRRIVGKSARGGAYTVEFDAKKKFSKHTTPQTGGTLTVTKTFG
jgi:hypothetical protein